MIYGRLGAADFTRRKLLARGRRLHKDDVVRRDEVQGGADAFVERVRVDMFRPEVRTLDFESCALCPNRLQVGGGRADLPVQPQPCLKPALTLDKMVGEISGQRDPENRTDNQMGAP